MCKNYCPIKYEFPMLKKIKNHFSFPLPVPAFPACRGHCFFITVPYPTLSSSIPFPFLLLPHRIPNKPFIKLFLTFFTLFFFFPIYTQGPPSSFTVVILFSLLYTHISIFIYTPVSKQEGGSERENKKPFAFNFGVCERELFN